MPSLDIVKFCEIPSTPLMQLITAGERHHRQPPQRGQRHGQHHPRPERRAREDRRQAELGHPEGRHGRAEGRRAHVLNSVFSFVFLQ